MWRKHSVSRAVLCQKGWHNIPDQSHRVRETEMIAALPCGFPTSAVDSFDGPRIVQNDLDEGRRCLCRSGTGSS